MRPLTDRVPKPLLPVVNQPLLGLLMAQLRVAGVNRIGINASHLSDQICRFVCEETSRWPDLSVEVAVEDTPSGPAGALRLFPHFFNESDAVLVLSGDAFIGLDVRRVLSNFESSNATMSVVTAVRQQAVRYGVAMSNGSGRIVAWNEKPDVPAWQWHQVSCGIYCLGPAALAALSAVEVADFGVDLIVPLLRSGGAVTTCLHRDLWIDVGTPSALLKANMLALTGKARLPGVDMPSTTVGSDETLARVSVEGAVLVGQGAVIERDVSIVGPCVIGPNARVRQGARLHGAVVLAGATVQAGARYQWEVVV